jgi:rhodanese-related sulfurtransferase
MPPKATFFIPANPLHIAEDRLIDCPPQLTFNSKIGKSQVRTETLALTNILGAFGMPGKLAFFLTLMTLFWALPATPQAQGSNDFLSLVSKSSTGEFDVKGALKVDHAKALELQKSGAVFVDVRRNTQYRNGHIPGSVNLELNTEFSNESLAKVASKNQMVAFYCSDTRCYRSAHASAKALNWGYTNVVYFAEGWSVWLAQGYPRN